jgi:hypothetical protein
MKTYYTVGQSRWGSSCLSPAPSLTTMVLETDSTRAEASCLISPIVASWLHQRELLVPKMRPYSF